MPKKLRKVAVAKIKSDDMHVFQISEEAFREIDELFNQTLTNEARFQINAVTQLYAVQWAFEQQAISSELACVN